MLFRKAFYDGVGWTGKKLKPSYVTTLKALMNLGQDPLSPDSADEPPYRYERISTGTSNHDFLQVGNGYYF